MPITDWHDPYNSVDDFRKELSGKSDAELFAIAEKWRGRNPGIAALLILAERKDTLQKKIEEKKWWERPLGFIALSVISGILTVAIIYIIKKLQ